MGIYINGMEMPKYIEPGLVIEFANDNDGKRYARLYHYRHGGLPEWFEAVSVPEHGRLIDADALEPKLKFIAEAEAQIYGTASWNFVGKCRIALAEAQTVIPAEPAEEGE